MVCNGMRRPPNYGIRSYDFNPELAEPHFNLTSIYLNLGNFQEASIHSKKAMELDPDGKEALLNYSVAEFTLGNIKNAISSP